MITKSNPSRKKAIKALVAMILLTLLYLASIWPLFFLTGLMLMSYTILDQWVVFLTIAAYGMALVVTIPLSIWHYLTKAYDMAFKLIWIPLGCAVLFALAFYYFVVLY